MSWNTSWKTSWKPRGKAVINRNVINAVYLSRYKRANFFVKIFNKKLIKINKKIFKSFIYPGNKPAF
jgi:hypothetical protein